LFGSKALTRAPNPPYPAAATHDADVEAAVGTCVDRADDATEVTAVDDERPLRPPDWRLTIRIAAAVANIAIANPTNLEVIKTEGRASSVTITYTSADTSGSWREESAMKRSDAERFIYGRGYRRSTSPRGAPESAHARHRAPCGLMSAEVQRGYPLVASFSAAVAPGRQPERAPLARVELEALDQALQRVQPRAFVDQSPDFLD
jgi:hypothetical protein